MNILPKKRWHVRTKENIARVRRDEAQAAEERKNIEIRAKLAEQEARTSSLRTKARELYDGRTDTKEEEKSVQAVKETGHINFFKDVEDGLTVHSGHNKEYELEQKEEKEKYEKKIGYLTYLGQDTEESTGNTSWYTRAPGPSSGDDKEVNISSKRLIDPLNVIKRFLGKDYLGGRGKTSTVSDSDERKCDDNYKRIVKHSRREGRESTSGKAKVNLNELRRQRLLREQKEKVRVAQLLGKIRGTSRPESEPAAPSVVHQKYSSQFNPSLARQNFNSR